MLLAEGNDQLVAAANARTPGVIRNDTLVKRALSMLNPHIQMGRDVRREDFELEGLFSYHFGPSRIWRDSQELVAISFNDPQSLVDRPDWVEARIMALGPKTIRALAQFATAVTTTRPIQP